MAGTLYVVGTPIGNLKDITYRAVETLSSVDVIACEDTRVSLKLLSYYNVKKPLISYYKQKEREGSEKIISLLSGGQKRRAHYRRGYAVRQRSGRDTRVGM